jgi:hypothetical protein
MQGANPRFPDGPPPSLVPPKRNLKKPRRPPVRGFFFLELVVGGEASESPHDKIWTVRIADKLLPK